MEIEFSWNNEVTAAILSALPAFAFKLEGSFSKRVSEH